MSVRRAQLAQKLAEDSTSVRFLKSLNLVTFPVNKNPALDEAGLHVCKAMQSLGRNADGLVNGLPDCDSVITLNVDLCCAVMDPHALDNNEGFFDAGPAREVAIDTVEFVVELCKVYDFKLVLRSDRASKILHSLFGAFRVQSPGEAATAAGVPFTLRLTAADSGIVTLLFLYGTRPHFPNWTVSGGPKPSVGSWLVRLTVHAVWHCGRPSRLESALDSHIVMGCTILLHSYLGETRL